MVPLERSTQPALNIDSSSTMIRRERQSPLWLSYLSNLSTVVNTNVVESWWRTLTEKMNVPPINERVVRVIEYDEYAKLVRVPAGVENVGGEWITTRFALEIERGNYLCENLSVAVEWRAIPKYVTEKSRVREKEEEGGSGG